MAQTVPAGLAGWLAALTGTAPSALWRPTSGAVLAVCGDAVVKVHPAGTDPAGLTARLRVASAAALDGVLAAPLRAEPVPVPVPVQAALADRDAAGLLATVWPRLDVLAPDVAEPPWAAAARTLARLHRTAPPPEAGLPPHGAPDRLRRALDRVAALGLDPRAVAVLHAGRRTERALARAGAEPTAGGLVHGDWHLGQLGRDAAGRWLLLDLDDLGLGDPAWDLGRPAGFWAAGLLDDASWTTFLAAYREAGGPVPPDGDPWPRLDVPARAEVVVAAARAVHRAHHGKEAWDDTAEALLAACARM